MRVESRWLWEAAEKGAWGDLWWGGVGHTGPVEVSAVGPWGVWPRHWGKSWDTAGNWLWVPGGRGQVTGVM